MSEATHGWESWIRFAKQSGQGTIGSTWHTYDADGADSLTMGEVPIQRTGMTGNRKPVPQAYRRGHFLPGGGLGAYPVHFAAGTGATAPTLLLLRNHCGSYAVSSGGGTAQSTFTFTPLTAQVATADWPYLTFQKDTGLAGAGELYLDSWIDELQIDWAVDSQYMTLTPTIKALSGGTAQTITGDGTAISNGFFDASCINCTWQGTAIYPTGISITSSNNTPEGQANSVRGRKRVSLGDWTGAVSLSMPRDSNLATWFTSLYGGATQGTLAISGTLPVSYGTTLSGNALTWTLTCYGMVAPTTHPTGAGELIDTVDLVLNDWTWAILSDLTTI